MSLNLSVKLEYDINVKQTVSGIPLHAHTTLRLTLQ